MNKFLAWLVLALQVGLGLPALAADPTGPTPIPVEQFRLADHQGKVVILDFWASWCKPCQKSLPWLADMQEKYGPQGLVIVAVNLDENLKDAAAMVAGLPVTVILVHDPQSKLAEKYQLEGMPSAYIYGRDGKLVATHVGFHEKDTPEKEAALAALLSEGSNHGKE